LDRVLVVALLDFGPRPASKALAFAFNLAALVRYLPAVHTPYQAPHFSVVRGRLVAHEAIFPYHVRDDVADLGIL
jgi:hypothetical protein